MRDSSNYPVRLRQSNERWPVEFIVTVRPESFASYVDVIIIKLYNIKR